MVLTDLQIKFSYRQLTRLLKTGDHGTVFSHLLFLERLRVRIELGESDDYKNIDLLTENIGNGCPVIVSVETAELQTYWSKATSHAVVVVGIDEQNVMVNDPAFDVAPQVVPINEFLIAWGEHYYRYAILTKK